MIDNCKNFAFTLAEVLITLGIIGVVAAMTVPTVINNIKHVELESRFKKTTSELQIALQKVQFDEGETIYGNVVGNDIVNVLVKQFKAPAKIQNRHSITYGKLKNRDIIYKNYDGLTNYNTHLLDDGTIIVNDNFFIFINNDNGWLNNQQLYIDTNGFKKPNRLGYDLFLLCLAEGDKINYSCNVYTQKAFSEKDYFKNLPR